MRLTRCRASAYQRISLRRQRAPTASQQTTSVAHSDWSAKQLDPMRASAARTRRRLESTRTINPSKCRGLHVILQVFQQSGRSGSNRQHSAWKADALPLSYARVSRIVVALAAVFSFNAVFSPLHAPGLRVLRLDGWSALPQQERPRWSAVRRWASGSRFWRSLRRSGRRG